jgi:alpha-L-rhamnosidase
MRWGWRAEWGAVAVRAVRLRCEHREDTPCVDALSPRFGWTLEATGRDRRQTGYRIRVGLEGDDLVCHGRFWDTGLVDSEEAIEIPYTGTPLPSASTLAWAVQVRDESGTVHEWSAPACFRTGLATWSGAWIGRDKSDDPGISPPDGVHDPDAMLEHLDPVPYFRRDFSIEPDVRRATLYFTARGLVEMELNGMRVGDSMLVPGWTDYHRRIEYHTHDVTNLVRKGLNTLGAIVGHGWYAGNVGMLHRRHAAWYGEEPELLCELRIEHSDGDISVVSSDANWRASARGPIRYSDLLHGEHYDARKERAGWSTPGFEDQDWDPVITSPVAEGPLLVSARAQPVRVTQDLRPVSVTEQSPGNYVFDLGQNMVGWARLRIAGPKGARVELRFAEMLDADGSLYVANLRGARPIDTFVLQGTGHPETFEPRFTFHGFRYVEVRGAPTPLTVDSVTGRVVQSDTPTAGSFTCSNEMVNQLVSNIEWGQRGNFLSVPTDCPQRDERLGWLADAQVFLPTATLNADLAAFVTKWGDDVLDAQSADGAYSDVAPRLVCTRDGAPAWADAGVIVPWIQYQRYGDRRLLERHWPHMERYLSLLQRDNPDLLWTRRRNNDYGDWLAVDESTSNDVIATAYWAHDADLMAKIANVLGLPGRSDAYARLHAGIADAFNAVFVDGNARIHGDTQTAYVLALAFDLLPEKKRLRAARHLVENIQRRQGHLATGFLGVGLICPVLTRHGYAEIAHQLLAQDTYPSWGYSIRHGATTIWERWDGWTNHAGFQTPDMNSFNHYSFGSVGAWLYEYVGGIRLPPGAAAYSEALIAPTPGPMTTARTTFRSVRGDYSCTWRQKVNRFELDVSVPPNCRATVVIPVRGLTLYEGGGPVSQAIGVRGCERNDDFWNVGVASGEYKFVSC